jgi:hypothetical protein
MCGEKEQRKVKQAAPTTIVEWKVHDRCPVGIFHSVSDGNVRIPGAQELCKACT